MSNPHFNLEAVWHLIHRVDNGRIDLVFCSLLFLQTELCLLMHGLLGWPRCHLPTPYQPRRRHRWLSPHVGWGEKEESSSRTVHQTQTHITYYTQCRVSNVQTSLHNSLCKTLIDAFSFSRFLSFIRNTGMASRYSIIYENSQMFTLIFTLTTSFSAELMVEH